MKKQDIIEKLKKINIDKNKFIVLSGASMVVQGVKEETEDIDLSTNKEYFDIIKWKQRESAIGTIVKYCEIFEIGYDFYYTKDTIKIEGFNFLKLEKILEIKEKYKRQKDKEDIFLLKKYFKNKEEDVE